jgi:hypothetical protein
LSPGIRLEKPMNKLALLLIAAFCASAAMADGPKLKPGWKDDDIKAFVDACATAIVKPAVDNYDERVKASGRTDAKPFPEQEFRDSVIPMCECISHRMAETWTLQELAHTALEKSKPFVEEALSGGQCKPGGLLGDMLKHAAEAETPPPATPANPPEK